MTGPASDLTGLVFPGPPGQGIDHLQALWARDCARRAAEMLKGADEPCAIEVARGERAVLVVPEHTGRGRSGAVARRSAEARLDEAQGLAEAIGIAVVARLSYRLRAIRPATLRGGTFRTYADHRMAHAGVILGLAVDDVLVEDVATTSKTFPDFADAWSRAVRGTPSGVGASAGTSP